ncbi:diacylglycerol kinase family protein [Leucobacter luti]|uniref:Diacylglycerol kinase family enzyme n=1 Tax=Leucobacter luti TaxID=340320 RepID=A0A4R6RWM7_9MICO|nr:diacylglycerol kinase family protein [Leucobacter luti]QYM75857.1 NAD(+)/NADH kinase [Leucobacter luti]TDP91430.1 diacylglycerol kinase family enzyme [Leucobacter luti]
MVAVHVGIVWNPSKTERAKLAAALPDPAPETVSWHETSVEDPGRAATQEALDAGATVVLAAGGDGTVRAVAEHLADTGADAELGVIPLGTGNLLARNLGIPLNDLPAAFARALDGEASPLDIGWAELTLESGVERYAFAVMAGFGIDAHMITETNDDLKDRAGWLAYIESLGRAVSASAVIGVTLTREPGPDAAESVAGAGAGSAAGSGATDPTQEHEQAHTLIIGNCGMLQGGITLLPDADPTDGELDLLVLRADGVAGWADTLRNMVWDNGLKRFLTRSDTAESSGSTSHDRITSLTIELDEPRVFEVDGDDLGLTSRIVISTQAGGVRVR